MKLPDGLTEVAHAMPTIMELIAASARWVHPNVFAALPVWAPHTARKLPLYQADWITPQLNKGLPKPEGNVGAQKSLMAALGVVGRFPKNWTTCHIWGYDDGGFATGSAIVRDRRYFSCVANMVLLPTPLKGFTDTVPEVKRHLRVCAYHLYGWACEHATVEEEASIVRSGAIPDGYPESWPTSSRKCLPPGTGEAAPHVFEKILQRKKDIAKCLADTNLTYYPRDEVRSVLSFWNIALEESDGRTAH